jgi:3-methyladenine DNA glycosylase/8-oxoguanine DNA glycosylase
MIKALAYARRHLLRVDSRLAPVIRRVGPCRLDHRQSVDPFAALIHSIASQQLSASASATIFRRVCELFSGSTPTPAGIAALDDERLRSAGLSRPKIRYLRDLAMHVSDGRLNLADMHHLSDREVLDHLTAVKGIGVWTAEIFLMFRLGRLDVLPADDLGLMRAAQKVYGLRKRPTPERLRKIGEPWRPYRSVGCWYLWASLSQEEEK